MTDVANETKIAAGVKAAKSAGIASAAKRRAEAARLQRFREEITRRVALTSERGEPDPLKLALIDSACALYAVILRRSSLSGGVNRKVNPLALSAAITGLRSIMRTLNLSFGDDAEDPNLPPGVNATPEQRREWSQKYIQTLVRNEKDSNQ